MKKKVYLFTACLFSLFIVLFYLSGCSAGGQIKKVSKDLSNYKINVDIDEDNMQLFCSQDVNVVNNNLVPLGEVCFNLYASAFSEDAVILPYTAGNSGKVFPNGISYGDIVITNLKVNDKTSVYSICGEDNNALKIPLETTVEPKESVLVHIDYVVTLPECTHRLGFFGGSINLGNFFPILAIYKEGDFKVAPYYSTGDPFFSDIANFEVEVNYPKSYNLASTGQCVKSVASDDKKTDIYKALAVRDFAMFLTQNAQIETKISEKTQITYVGYEKDENIKQCLDTAVKAVTFFNKTFGKYPYATLTIVKAPFVHGGMEYPNLVIISDSITEPFDIAKVIVHEVAHQWWYGLVGNNEVTEAWLDESLAEYSTLLFFEAHPEYQMAYDELVNQATAMYTLYADIVNVVEGNIKTSMLLPVNEYNSEYEYSYMVYVKGIIMFDSLRSVIGAKKLNSCFKKYFSTYKFKIATTDDLIESFRKTAGRDIEGFFDSWLSGKTIVGEIR
ncbi:MAG: M1 family metallopeptidase [Clostridia bacterium]|nr:M1 family metallopeptidase [Clostridia bacterium]